MYGCQNWHPAMICWGLGGFGVGLTGALKVNTKEDMAENSNMIVLWGANIASQPNTARHIISVGVGVPKLSRLMCAERKQRLNRMRSS